MTRCAQPFGPALAEIFVELELHAACASDTGNTRSRAISAP
jgi:hypothetical protein